MTDHVVPARSPWSGVVPAGQHLTIVDLESWNTGNRQSAHLQSVMGRRYLPICFLPWVPGWDQQNTIEPQLVQGAFS